jgi:KaiC/GvpD/RAD55 family RecA-like ATPase
MSESRISTGIAGFDNLIGGGFIPSSLILVAGGPGAGKTTFCLQYLLSGARAGEKGIYISFTETANDLRRLAASLNWSDLPALEKKGLVRLIDFPVIKAPGLDVLLNELVDQVRSMNAKRLVVDSVTSITISLQERVETRVVLSLLRKSLKETECTTLLITENPWGSQGIGSGIEEFLADGIILLETVPYETELRRRLMVLKMRSVVHDMRYYQFNIVPKQGIVVIPYPVTMR